MRYPVKVFEVPPYNPRVDGPQAPKPVPRADLAFVVSSDTVDGARAAVMEQVDPKKLRGLSFCTDGGIVVYLHP